MKIYIGADHAGYNLKIHLIPYLQGLGFEVEDCGAVKMDKDDNYPVYISKVAKAVSRSWTEARGIVIGGTGQGEAMMANRFPRVRAALFYGGSLAHEAVDVEGRESGDTLEIVRLSRLHNNSNVLSISARFVNEDEVKAAVKLWLDTKFEGEARHKKRIRMIEKFTPRRVNVVDILIIAILIWVAFIK
jgi:ribose 5-phosphate isomerase B